MSLPVRIASAAVRNCYMGRTLTRASLVGVIAGALFNGDCEGGLLYNFAASYGAYQTCAGNTADFDIDKDIDGSDFLQWQRGHGKVGQFIGALGDANKSAFVNFTDLEIWQAFFGASLVGIPESTCFKLYFDPEGVTAGSVTLVLDVPFVFGVTRFGLGADTRLVDVHQGYTAQATTPVILSPALGRQQLETTVTFQAINPTNPPAGPVTIFGFQVMDLFPNQNVGDFKGRFEFRPGNFITTFDPATNTSETRNDTQLTDVLGIDIVAPLMLDVNLVSGAVTIRNQSQLPTSLNYYEITSLGGGLSPTGWVSLADTEMNSPGIGWDEAGGSDAMALAETRLDGALEINPGLVQTLGAAYNPASRLRDLVFLYGTPGGSLIPGEINYITGAPVTGVPEPSCLVLAMCLLSAAVRRRRASEI